MVELEKRTDIQQVPKRKPKLLKEKVETKPLGMPKKFVTFSTHDSRSIESAYQKLIEEDEDSQIGQIQEESGTTSGAPGKKENTSITEAGKKEDAGGRVKVPVNEDFLFDVDIEVRELAPVYWLGPIYEVRRGTWFYQESAGLRPCEENLALQLEEGYLKIKPFRYPKNQEKTARPVSVRLDDPKSTVSLPVSEAIKSGDLTSKASRENLKAAAHSKADTAPSNTKELQSGPHSPQTYRLFGTWMSSIVTYQDDTVAWLSSDNFMSQVSTTIYQRFAGGGYLGGVKIVRGYTEPRKVTDTKPERPATPISENTNKIDDVALQVDERQQRILKRRSAPPGPLSKPSNDDDESDNSESRESKLKRQLSNMIIDSMDPEANEAAVRERDEKEIQDDYKDHDGENQNREIEHLILVTHGIGQRLGMR